MCLTKQLLVPIDFHSIFLYYESQWLPSTFWLSRFFKISSFVFNTKHKKFIQVPLTHSKIPTSILYRMQKTVVVRPNL